MNIEKKAKELVSLYKKYERLEKQLANISTQISDTKSELTNEFEDIGLDSSFSS